MLVRIRMVITLAAAKLHILMRQIRTSLGIMRMKQLMRFVSQGLLQEGFINPGDGGAFMGLTILLDGTVVHIKSAGT